MVGALRIIVELVKYEAIVVPLARRQIRRWTDAAAAIPDPRMRETATDAIAVDAGNAEAAAAFAAMAPRPLTRVAVELLVAYQILFDYVDALGERVCADRLLRGLATGMALTAALARPSATLALGPLGDDGGYLVALVSACRSRFWRLPSAAAVERQAVAAAERCAQALAYTHAAAERGTSERLREWAAAQPATTGYAWWEIAAGGNSDLALLALLGAAADPATTPDDAAAVAAAYWPHMCVMSTMLDSLVDCEQDALSGNFSFVAWYADDRAARDGLIGATRRSLGAIEPLPRIHVHAMIVCGIAGYYAAIAAPGSRASDVARDIVAVLGPTAAPVTFALQARHRLAVSPSRAGQWSRRCRRRLPRSGSRRRPRA